MNKNWNDRADKDLFFTILSVKNIGVISGSEWVTIGNHMRSLGYGFTNEGCRYVLMLSVASFNLGRLIITVVVVIGLVIPNLCIACQVPKCLGGFSLIEAVLDGMHCSAGYQYRPSSSANITSQHPRSTVR
jgi:hypothetical protein